MKTDLTLDATTKCAESLSERLDYELLAARRMGFDYLYVWTKHDTKDWESADLKMSIQMGVFASDDPDWKPSRKLGTVERYDLSGLTREKVQEVRNTTGN